MKTPLFAAAAAAMAAVLVATTTDAVKVKMGSEVDLEDVVRLTVDQLQTAEVEAEALAELEMEAMGIENCLNKCQNLFDNTQYTLNVQGTETYEGSACRVGCTICSAILAAEDPDLTKCFTTCKNTDWLQNIDSSGNPFPITKGVIEPDKACEFGCIINLCQGVCQGGTTDMKVTPSNQPSWWGNGGCSIKTGGSRPGGYYSQNALYNQWNSPQGSGGQAECCAQAYSLCKYAGDKSSTNYANVLAQAQLQCKNVPGAGQTAASICSYWSSTSNCGSQL